MRKDFKIGGRVGFNRGGSSAPFLRGRSGASNIKAPRGSEGWKQMQKAEAKLPKTKSDYKLENQVKKIKKTPDKEFKDVNLTSPHNFGVKVKGSKGKKNYIQMTKYYHHRAQPKGKK